MDTFYRDLAWLPRPSANFSAACRSIEIDPADAAEHIESLARSALDDNQLMRLARLIKKLLDEDHPLEGLTRFRLGYIGNGTSDFIQAALVATAARYGLALDCVSAGYDQTIQATLNPASPLYEKPLDAVLIALDWRGVPLRPRFGENDDETVDGALQFMETVVRGLETHSKALRIVQNFAPPAPRILGSLDRVLQGSPRHALDRLNAALAPKFSSGGRVMLDIAGLSETVGLAHWHSAAEWNMAKLPFAQAFVPLYADYVCRTIAALRGRSRRCLVLDLDNTLWGGVIGDDGLAGIQIAQGDAAGEAYLDFQRYILTLRAAGIALAVSSKNDDETARLPFRRHPEMLLKEEHFALFQANWNDKPTNIKAIADTLALGLESLVFVDDNPFERQFVRKTLPQVAVPEMPADPALYTQTLSAAGYFESIGFSAEDANRAAYYEGNSRRASLQRQVSDVESYLASLEMEIWFRPFDETGRERIAQLINKSNQFNLTTRRYSEVQVAEMENSGRYFTLQVRLKDTFGDNGMIGVLICRERSSKEWEIDTWLMSCRVLGRRVENMVLKEVLLNAANRGIRRLRGFYIPTGRNKLVEGHYANLGFRLIAEHPDGSTEWEMDVAGADVAGAPMAVHSERLTAP